MSLLFATVRNTLQFLASGVCMDNRVWFSMDVSVCALIMVIGVRHRQMGNDLKFNIKRKIDRIFQKL